MIVEAMEDTDRVRRAARRVLVRLRAVSWWRAVMAIYPGGVVPMGTASRVLGVSRKRMNELVRDGTVPLVEGMPGGGRRDRFVPVDALIGLATTMQPGKPVGHLGPRFRVYRGKPLLNPWYRVYLEHGISPDHDKLDEIVDDFIQASFGRLQLFDPQQLTLWETPENPVVQRAATPRIST